MNAAMQMPTMPMMNAMMPMMNAMGMNPMMGMGMNPMMAMMMGGMPMNGMMPMMGSMPMNGMMPAMMCKMTCTMTDMGMTCEMTPMDESAKDMFMECCKRMQAMMGAGMPMMTMCGGIMMMCQSA